MYVQWQWRLVFQFCGGGSGNKEGSFSGIWIQNPSNSSCNNCLKKHKLTAAWWHERKKKKTLRWHSSLWMKIETDFWGSSDVLRASCLHYQKPPDGGDHMPAKSGDVEGGRSLPQLQHVWHHILPRALNSHKRNLSASVKNSQTPSWCLACVQRWFWFICIHQ